MSGKPVKMQKGGTPMTKLQGELGLQSGKMLSDADVARIQALVGSRNVPADMTSRFQRFLNQKTGNTISNKDIASITKILSEINPRKPSRMKKGGPAKMKDGGVVRGAGSAISGTTFRGVR